MNLKKNTGNVLMITLMIVTLAVVGVGMVLSETSTIARNTERSRKYQGAQEAASGAVDYAYAFWLRKIAATHNLLTTADLVIPNAPTFPAITDGSGNVISPEYEYVENLQIRVLNQYGVSGTSTVPDMVKGPVPGYPGWWGRTYIYAATAIMRAADDPSAPSAGVRRLFYYTEVPLFQSMFFFQDDLEIYNPAEIIITGAIHTNGSLYLAAQQNYLEIKGPVSYVGTCVTGSTFKPSGISTITGYDANWTGGGKAAQLRQVTPISVMGADLDTLFDTSSSDNNLSGGYHELIEPPFYNASTGSTSLSGTDNSAVSDRRLYNVAANTNDQTGSEGGLIIQVTGTNITSSSIELTTLDATTHLPKVIDSSKTVRIAVGKNATLTTGAAAVTAFYNALSKKTAVGGTSTLSGSSKLYDDRQSKYVNVVDVDLAKLQTAIKTYITNFSDVVYIYDTGTTKFGSTTTQNTVRLLNGYNIASDDGMTIASVNPVYIQGNFNTSGSSSSTIPSNSTSGTSTNYATGYTVKPTSIVADAVTLLSNTWSDVKSGTTYTSRDASNTTYNVALLGGYMQTSGSSYSGGAINYPRFLEDWDGKNCVYYGSMVELFPSVTGTAPWRDTNATSTNTPFYKPPKRFYNFDSKVFSTKSPPGSVSAIVKSRGIWSPYP